LLKGHRYFYFLRKSHEYLSRTKLQKHVELATRPNINITHHNPELCLELSSKLKGDSMETKLCGFATILLSLKRFKENKTETKTCHYIVSLICSTCQWPMYHTEHDLLCCWNYINNSTLQYVSRAQLK
jgi:hypothetical protein